MDESTVTVRELHAFKRFIERLPHGENIDLVILKAHLLVQDEINALVRERLKNGDVLLNEERFESIYRIRLARALFEPGHLPWLWHAVEQLNKLRNRVAHSIDPKGCDDIMQDIVQSIPTTAGAGSRPLKERFEFALWSLFEAVSSLVENRLR